MHCIQYQSHLLQYTKLSESFKEESEINVLHSVCGYKQLMMHNDDLRASLMLSQIDSKFVEYTNTHFTIEHNPCSI